MTKKDLEFAHNYSIKTAVQLRKVLEKEPLMGTVAAAEDLARKFQAKYPALTKQFKITPH